ncbi:alpha/beta hydrolase [Colwellia sp. Arc7-635]|uniref:alpha/beta hydrolase n=1 Tax=Colwellia sp. Arc7-635 TaxID=2497879 RepID=UPI000F8501DE|nr:alpha/beta hydrolase [Colwellia sp. Arc7-635]AZQ83720.1 alpha/beta hydrolase [Colwellia sp. Arc7-635]
MPRYTYFLLNLVIAIGLLSGCNSTDKDSASINEEAALGRVAERSYLVATPSKNFDENKSYKLLIAFHGSGQIAKDFRDMVSIESSSDNYIVVYPQSKVEEWNEGCNCNKPHRLGIDDLGFIEDVIADVRSSYNIIDNELYAVGFSQGGLFAQNVMCNSKLQFKAIASVASPMSVRLSEACNIKNNTNYMMVHGKADQALPYRGLNDKNFGLISSESAIELIAKKNDIYADVELETVGNISKYIYKNDSHINQLIGIAGGGHRWTFDSFDTTNEILSFFDSNSKNQMDSYSKMYRVDQENNKDVNVRSMGLEHSGPAIILLSGFNQNYHSDSAWFSLLQPLIAKTHRVHAIERFGNGSSSMVAEPSYASFAPVLDKTLGMLNEEEFIIVSFSSANILAHLWQNLPSSEVEGHLKGMVWVDPDILLPHSISLYQDWPVSWYREKGDVLLEHIQQGNWTEKTRDKVTNERIAVSELISDNNKETMDWQYFDLISQSRSDIDKQVNRAKEIINYYDDLAIVEGNGISTDAPITVIDTDFESFDIANADEADVDSLLLWQQEGSQWSQFISENSGGQYVPLLNSDHMAVFQHPEEVIKAISYLSNQ